jgi:hypothetical protein
MQLREQPETCDKEIPLNDDAPVGHSLWDKAVRGAGQG